MTPPAGQPIDAELASFLSFWTEAGVDVAYADEAQDRLKPPPLRATPKALQPSRTASSSPAYAATAANSGAAAQDATAMAQAASDLAALEAAIAAFDGCPLKTQGATRAVFARGRPDASVMVIGEGPGADEDRQGQPFVGRAGKLMDKMLAAAGVLDDAFITNTVFWRPPGNRTPTPAEQGACRPFVERAIALVKPKVLVLAGGASAKAMLNTNEGILSLHGRWSDWTSADGALVIPALPTLHPAFLLRQPLAKKKAWADLLTLVAKLDGGRGDA